MTENNPSDFTYITPFTEPIYKTNEASAINTDRNIIPSILLFSFSIVIFL